MATASEKRHLALLHRLSCVVCLNCYGLRRPAQEAHHLEFTRGDHSTFATVPLCKQCHDALHHDHRRAFYLAHRIDDVKLLAWTIRLIEEASLQKEPMPPFERAEK